MDGIPEAVVARACEWVDAISLWSARAVNKPWMAAVEACGREVVRSCGFDGGLRELVELELRAFDFDGFSDDGFVHKPRSGTWLEWGSGVIESSMHRSCEFRLYAAMRTKPPLARRRLDVERMTTGVALGARGAAQLFRDRALSAAVVCCPATQATRAIMQHANFFGPAQRWVPLHSLVEDLDVVTDYTLRNANLDNGVFLAAAAFDRPPPRIMPTIPCRLPGFRPSNVLLLTHVQFAKLQDLLGADRFAELFDIPSDMSIYMGGHGTTPAVILLSLGDVAQDVDVSDAASFFWPRQPNTWLIQPTAAAL